MGVPVYFGNGFSMELEPDDDLDEIMDELVTQGLIDDSTQLVAPPENDVDRERSKGMGIGEIVEGVLTEMGQGASANFMDEAAGATSVFDPKKSYEDTRNKFRENSKRFRKDYPIGTAASQFAGSLLPLGKFFRGKNVGRNMEIGAGMSGLDYVGNVDEMKNINIPDMSLQMLMGGLTPAATKLGGKALKYGKNLITNRSGQNIEGLMEEISKKTGRSKEEIREAIENADPRYANTESIVDLFSNTAPYARAAREATTDSSILGRVRADMDRSPGAKGRVASNLVENDMYGPVKHGSRARTKTAADKAFTKIDETNYQMSEKMYDLANKNPAVAEALEEVIPSQMGYARTMGEPLEISGENLRRVRMSLKDTMDNLREREGRVGASKAKKLESVDAELADVIDDIAPGYKAANKTYSDNLIDEEMLLAGREHGVNKLNIDEQLDFIGSFSTPGSSKMYETGLTSNLMDKLGKTREESLSALNAASSSNSKRVLDKVMGENRTKSFQDAINKERAMQATEKVVMGGTPNQLKKIALSGMGGDPGNMKLAHPKKMGGDAISQVVNRALNPELSPKVAGRALELLTNPQLKGEAMEMLTREFGREQAEIAMRIANTIGVGGLMRTPEDIFRNDEN
ncbi:MAG: hypothetical protein DRP85_03255 [Candidatus Makaraimicrobium thalassicum]|nr:MAG: hypothetical protein DRP85_03255 [Candidatus Omnitrophota bacterium]